jgi:hypothetical protein
LSHGILAVYGDLLLAAVVLAVPAAAGLLVAVSVRVQARAAQAIFAFAAPCVLAYGVAGFYLLSPVAGRAVSVAAYAATLILGAWLWRRDPAAARTLKWWAVPGLMTVAAAAFVLGLGFLHGHTEIAGREPEIRYIRRLANDNVLPHLFADQLLAARRPLPRILSTPGPWLSSDRPPMQTCLYLLIRSVTPRGDRNRLLYEASGALFQSFWLPALWCLMILIRLPRRLIALTLAAVLASGFVIFNAFYVWPKLFAAAFVVLLAALVLTDEWAAARSKAWVGAAGGIAAAVGILGHEGAVLGIVPLVLIVLASRELRPRLRAASAGAAAFVLLLVPWTLYQRFYDPPGTALLKLLLADTQNFTAHQGAVTDIVNAYERLGFSQVVAHKWSNLTQAFVHEPATLKSFADLILNLFAPGGPGAAARGAAVEQLRVLSFRYFLPTLGLFALGPIAYALAYWWRGRRGQEMLAALRLWIYVALALVVWALVMLGPALANEVGSYAPELLAFAAGAISLWALSHRLAVGVCVFQIALGVVTYAVLNPVFAFMVPAPGALDPAAAVLATLGFLAVVWLCWSAPASEGGAAVIAHGRLASTR